MTTSVHPAAPHHLPAFITAPGETDVLMVAVAVFLVVAVLMVGILFLRLHTLAGAHGAQGAQAAVRDRRRAGPARPVHARASVLGRRPAARADRHPRFRRLAQPDRRVAEKIAGIETRRRCRDRAPRCGHRRREADDGVAAVADGSSAASDAAAQGSDKITRRSDARKELTHA